MTVTICLTADCVVYCPGAHLNTNFNIHSVLERIQTLERYLPGKYTVAEETALE